MSCDCNMSDLSCIVHKCSQANCPDEEHLDFTLVPINSPRLDPEGELGKCEPFSSEVDNAFGKG
jgi:hypothetical protein